jgi:hypothetical protein
MGFGPFVLLSLFYAVLGIRVVVQLATRWRTTFDRSFTAADRSLVDQAAFFVLVPISVALHELGHAVAIRALGGRIEGWGYYGFAGYVGYDPRGFSPAEQVLIAAAGTIVNLLLAAGALAIVFGRRPRAAINELLLQFTFLSLVNALVVYPLLDVLSGLNGDWSQIYFGGVPALSALIAVLHAAILGLLFWAWRSDRVRARVARLTDASPPLHRLRLGERRRDELEAATGAAASVEATLREAAARVASGWPEPVEGVIQRRSGGLLLVLTWTGGGSTRAVLAWAPDRGGVELRGSAQPAGFGPVMARDPGPVDADRLTLALRLAMETVAGWDPATQPTGSR